MKRGFTLAEVLIALTLTAIAVGIISEGVRQSLRFQQSLEMRRMEREAEAAILSALRSRLEHLIPAIREAERDEDGEILFIGEPNRLRFISADPGYPSIPGLYEYIIEIVQTEPEAEIEPETTATLTLFRRPIADLDSFARADPGLFQSWSYEVEALLEFGYSDGASASFVAQWSDDQTYPELISLTPEGDGLPALTVSLPQLAPQEAEETEEAITQ